MEAGAVPGSRDRDTGPVGLYSISSFSGRSSRALNRTERDSKLKALNDEMAERIEDVKEIFSGKFFKFLQEQVAGFRTHNHEIKIYAAMGAVFLKVDDICVSDYRRSTPLIDRLQEIDQLLEGSWDWASYLDGKVINKTSQEKFKMTYNIVVVTKDVPKLRDLLQEACDNGMAGFFEIINEASDLVNDTMRIEFERSHDEDAEYIAERVAAGISPSSAACLQLAAEIEESGSGELQQLADDLKVNGVVTGLDMAVIDEISNSIDAHSPAMA